MKKENSQKKSENCLPDEQILGMYWQRDEQAISETDIKYGKYLLTVAFNILHDPSDSEECQNDTYFDVWNTVPPTWPKGFLLFLTKIMRRTAIDRYRQRSSKKRVPSELTSSLDELGDMLSDGLTVEEEYDTAAIGAIISGYIQSLSDRSQLIFVYRYYYCDSLALIAKMTGLSEKTIYNELTDMKKGLRACLEKEGYNL